MNHQFLVYYSILLIALMTFGCQRAATLVNQSFDSSEDTLIISTQTMKGQYPGFRYGAGSIFWEVDVDSLVPFKYPEGISHMRVSTTHTDIKPFIKESIITGMMDTAEIRRFNMDTSIIEPFDWVSHSIIIMQGRIKEDTVLIVDSNQDQDLSNDPIYPFTTKDWFGTSTLYPCSYTVREGEQFIRDTSWLNIGVSFGKDLLHVSQYERAVFHLDDIQYEVVIHAENNHFTYEKPELVLTAIGDSTVTDTVSKNDIVKLTEFILLGDNYYRFTHISNTGKKITLVKDNSYKNYVGTQVGMIAPDFQVITVGGEILDKDNHQPTILANVTACTRDTYAQFREMAATLHGRMRVIPIESGVRENLPENTVNVEDSFNQDFSRIYRDAYSSTECLLISNEGRILNKFYIQDWKKYINYIP